MATNPFLPSQEAMAGIEQFKAEPATGLLAPLDYLARPGYAVSEFVQALGEGEGLTGAVEGISRGLQGYRKYGTLGEAAFPEAAEPGFQIQDIPAFGVDVLTDPITWIPFGQFGSIGGKAARLVGKYPAKGVLAAAKKILPESQKVLKFEDEMFATSKEVAPVLAKELEDLGISARQAINRVMMSPIDEAEKALMPKKWSEALDVGLQKYKEPFLGTAKAAGDVAGAVKKAKRVDTPLAELPKDMLDMVRAGMRVIEANTRPGAKNSLQNLATRFAEGWFPVGATLGKFGGPSGEKIFRGYINGMVRARKRESFYIDEMHKIFKGVKEEDAIKAVNALEGKIPAENDKIQRVADDLRGLLDAHWESLVADHNLDPMGRMIRVVDIDGNATDLINHRIEDYFPHYLKDEWYTGKGQKALRQKLIDSGMPEAKVDKWLRRAQNTKPRKMGHIEVARSRDLPDLAYETNPLKVLPKYFADSIRRQELSKEFGIGGEILEQLGEDAKRFGLSNTWVDRIVGEINGEHLHDEVMSGIARAITGAQAVTKLGFATTVANTSQLPLNAIIRNGFKNFGEAIIKGGVPLPGTQAVAGGTQKGTKILGIGAYNKGMMDDILRWSGGKRSKIVDFYMRGIGFDWSERMGRHIGAVAGAVEFDDILRQIQKADELKDTALRGKLATKLQDRYAIKSRELDDALTALRRDDPRLLGELRDRAAFKASDSIMHAFDLMDLPIHWRDPGWRLILQFKSFGYKQMEFMGREVLQPALQWMATDGKAGTIAPFLRSAALFPPVAVAVQQGREVAKGIPNYILWGEWNLRDPFWEDPHPTASLLNDMLYVGTLGLMGDVIEQAERRKLAPWVLGPTGSEVTRGLEEIATGSFRPGRAVTRVLPGAAAVNRGWDLWRRGDIPFEHFLQE